MWDDRDPRSDDTRDRNGSDPREFDTVAPRDVFTRDLDLPTGLERERVHTRDHDYQLRGSEVRALATIGAFRVVPAHDLCDDLGRAGDVHHGDLQRLRTAGLIQTVAPFARADRTTLVTLTARGKELLDTHRSRGSSSSQTFYAGAVKSRELTHDAQLHRAYVKAAERLREQGARIQRVVLDYELKREYQRFLQAHNKDRSDSDGRPHRSCDEIREWAREHDLPIVNDRVQFPDVRIEYEHPDGRRDLEDLEVTTWHYRGAHAAGKAQSGFTRFRGASSRVGGRSGRGKGSAPFDPHAAEEFL